MLSDKEKAVLNILCKYNTIIKAKNELKNVGITIEATYVMLHRLRKKARAWRIGTNQVLGFRHRNKHMDNLLADRSHKDEDYDT